jgi:hypothetical protein
VRLGNLDAAHAAARRLLEAALAFSVSIRRHEPCSGPPWMHALAAHLQTAGLPE